MQTHAGLVARLRVAGCVFAEDEAELLVAAARTPDELAALVDRRAGGEPLECVLGWAQFGGLRIIVEAGVFVPRRRSELLVSQAAALCRRGAVVLDMCCGSGAVGTALAVALGSAHLHAADIDPVAVRCARRNAQPLDGRVYLGDLYEPLPVSLRGRVDVLVANAPYVPSEAIALMPPEARLHEPRVALDGGVDGLDVQRRVIAGAPSWLARSGYLLVETSQRQAPLTVAACITAGLSARVVRSEDLDGTVVIATRCPQDADRHQNTTTERSTSPRAIAANASST